MVLVGVKTHNAMATTYLGKPSSFFASTGGVPKEGAWYGTQRIVNGQLTTPQVSEEVNRQSAAAQGKSYEEFSNFIKADQIQSPVQMNLPSGNTGQSNAGLQAEVDAARKTLETTLATQKAEADKKLAELKTKEQDTLTKVGELTTPFRAELETAERDRLYVNQNFEANQALVNELDQLLTEGNELIRQQSEVTGLAAVRNPRIQKTMNDVQARVGVIEAVMNARNGQIAQAQNMIDRSINAIAADRNDQLGYYNTILELNRQDILSLDKESKAIAEQQVGLLANDLSRAQDTQDYVKKLLIDPATAQLMGEAGVTLSDSVATINAKIGQAQYAREVKEMSNEVTLAGGQAVLDPKGIPADQLRTFVDSQGVKHYYKMPATGGSGAKIGSTEYTASIRSLAVDDLESNKNSYGHVSADYFKYLLGQYIQAGGTRDDFIKNFSQYADPYKKDFQQAYGFENPVKPIKVDSNSEEEKLKKLINGLSGSK